MLKRIICLLAAACLLAGCAIAEDARKVFMEGETEPFPEGTELLTLRVCPLQGSDSMLLTLGEHSMLVDFSSATQYKKVIKVLADAGLDGVEYAFSTHPHSDHIGGVIPLLNAGVGFGTYITVLPRTFCEDPLDYHYQEDAINAVEAAGIPVLYMSSGDRIPFGDAEITVLQTPEEKMERKATGNDLSGLLMIRYGECTLLLTADIEISDELILADMYDLKADILKYPHHGMSLLAPEFHDNVRPEYVFITNGAGDTKRGQRQLLDLGHTTMSFASWGVITMQTDGTKWIVKQDILPEFREIARRYVYGK